MIVKQSDHIEQLHEVVAQLGAALSVSERRTTRLERMIRWGALTIVMVLGLALVPAMLPLGHAVTQLGMKPSKSPEEAIDHLTQRLTGPESTLGQMGFMMQNMMSSAMYRAKFETERMPVAMQKSDCRVAATTDANLPAANDVKTARTKYPLGYYAKCYFLNNGISPDNGGYSDQQYAAALISAMGGAAVELGVLVHRIRHDSDFFQEMQAMLDKVAPVDALSGITQQLGTLNDALRSVPQMTNNMSVMTQQMGVMTADMTAMTHHMGNMNYSVGSTMGRMGNWMPW
jgi:hypothetical protein